MKLYLSLTVEPRMRSLQHPRHPAGVMWQPQHSASRCELEGRQRSDGSWTPAAAVEGGGGGAAGQPKPTRRDRRSVAIWHFILGLSVLYSLPPSYIHWLILLGRTWVFIEATVLLHFVFHKLSHIETYFCLIFCCSTFDFKIPRGPSSVFTSSTTPNCRFLLTYRVKQCWSYQRTCGQRFTPSSAKLVKQLLKNYKLQ